MQACLVLLTATLLYSCTKYACRSCLAPLHHSRVHNAAPRGVALYQTGAHGLGRCGTTNLSPSAPVWYDAQRILLYSPAVLSPVVLQQHFALLYTFRHALSAWLLLHDCRLSSSFMGQDAAMPVPRPMASSPALPASLQQVVPMC